MLNFKMQLNRIALEIRKIVKKTAQKLIIYRNLTKGEHKYKLLRFWYFAPLYRGKLPPEESLDIVLRAILKYKSGTFIDVGVNKGQTLLKLLSIDRHREYIGFEPNVMCCFYVEQFIRKNQLNSHHILPIGLSNRFDVLKFFSREESSDSSSVVKDFRPDSFYSYWQYVFVATGDFIISNLGLSSISVIKIDIEGGELEAIEGCRTIMGEHEPFIIFEVLSHYLVITKESLDAKTIEIRTKRIRQLENVLKEKDYSIFQIQPGKVLKKIIIINPGTEPDLSNTNYLAIPRSKEKEFLTLSKFIEV